MESSEDETDSSVIQHAYSFSDMLDELESEEASENSAQSEAQVKGQEEGEAQKEAEPVIGESHETSNGQGDIRVSSKADDSPVNGGSSSVTGTMPTQQKQDIGHVSEDDKAKTWDAPSDVTMETGTNGERHDADTTMTTVLETLVGEPVETTTDINGNTSTDISEEKSPVGGTDQVTLVPELPLDDTSHSRTEPEELTDDARSETLMSKTQNDKSQEYVGQENAWKRKKRKGKGKVESRFSSTSNESDDGILLQSDKSTLKMREKNSQSPDSDGVGARIVSDISGRFHVQGSIYADKNEKTSADLDHPQSPTLLSMKENEGYEPMEITAGTCILTMQGYDDGWYENIPDSETYENIPLDPKRNTLRRGASLKGIKKDMKAGKSKHATIDGSMKYVKVLPDDASSTDSTPDRQRRCHSLEKESTPESEDLYESIDLPQAPISPLTPCVGDQTNYDEDDYSWGSSEFESYEDEEPSMAGVGQEPISVTVEVKRLSDSSGQTVLDKLAAKLGPRSRSLEAEEDDTTYLEVTLNMERHPPPQLPPMPDSLTPNQNKRRHIVASIVDSERSYTASLRRIVEDYEKVLLLAKPSIISKSAVRVIFFKLRDILQCHNMFHIELAEYIRVWDLDEKIGNVFTASFSKSMVFDVYSAFVNNFSIAMETAKKQARQKQAFADFLKQKIQSAPDKLSLFGLMVKPVQRFPQFILCLQDLLKHTPRDHHDRLALQLALTELENLTHKLNETKRESENRYEVKKILASLTGRFSLKPDEQRHLVRQDDVIQMDCASGTTKTKSRRLFLMNDQLVCTSLIQKDTDTGLVEKYKFKWSVPIRDVEIVETEMPALYQVQGGPGRSTIVAPKLDRSTFSPWKKDLDDMMHDLPLIEQLSSLVSQLRRTYQGLTPEMLFGLQRALQSAIQQHGSFDLCILNLSIPIKYLRTSTDKLKQEMSKHIHHKSRTSRNRRMVHTFRTAMPSVKRDWVLDMKNAKLSLDPSNRPGWYVPEAEHNLVLQLPLFVRPLLIDVTKQDTRIQCAIPVMLPSHANPYVGTQHLWVCSNEVSHSQVTIVSLHTSQPHVLESFTACRSPILCAEVVPGYAVYDQEHAFGQDTVWMAMESNELCVRNVVEDERGAEPLLEIDTHGQVTCLRFMDGRLYAGLVDGRLVIYNRDRDGVWQIEDCQLVELGETAVNCLLPINHEMWAACENMVHVIRVTARWRGGIMHHDIQKTSTEVGGNEEEIGCMVRAGVGLMVSFKGRGVIRIYNQETFNHLQDINVASSVTHILEGKDIGDLALELEQVSITFLLSSKGLLWIGTNCGCALTLPLPRLEGVPQIKGRPSVSYHAHIGPIKFLVPIHCGVSQLHGPPTSPPSVSQSQVLYTEGTSGESESLVDSTHLSSDQVSGHSVSIEGVTETETCDDMDDVFVDRNYPYNEVEGDNGSIGFTRSDEYSETYIKQLSLDTDRDVVPNGDYLMVPVQGTLGRTKWTSTPDLRHCSHINLADSEEDVNNLYGSLLRSVDYEEYDNELMGPRRRKRPQSDLPAYTSLVKGDSSLLGPGDVRLRWGNSGRPNVRSKYATLPVLMEDCPVYALDNEALLEPNGHCPEDDVERSLSTRTPTPPVSPGLSARLSDADQDYLHGLPNTQPGGLPGSPDSPKAPLSPPHSTAGHGHHSTSKAVVIVSGGEGHINWSEKNAGDTKYDDICLLLWQCRV